MFGNHCIGTFLFQSYLLFSAQAFVLQVRKFVIEDNYAVHCGILEHWNSQKSLTSIRQHFSCRLDEIVKKNVLHIFAIPASSWHEKCCWMFVRLFWLFLCSRITQCITYNHSQSSASVSICFCSIFFWFLRKLCLDAESIWIN